jgi:hypothetical protein
VLLPVLLLVPISTGRQAPPAFFWLRKHATALFLCPRHLRAEIRRAATPETPVFTRYCPSAGADRHAVQRGCAYLIAVRGAQIVLGRRLTFDEYIARRRLMLNSPELLQVFYPNTPRAAQSSFTGTWWPIGDTAFASGVLPAHRTQMGLNLAWPWVYYGCQLDCMYLKKQVFIVYCGR